METSQSCYTSDGMIGLEIPQERENDSLSSSTLCSLLEQDSGPLERIFDISSVSPISIRRESSDLPLSTGKSNEGKEVVENGYDRVLGLIESCNLDDFHSLEQMDNKLSQPEQRWHSPRRSASVSDEKVRGDFVDQRCVLNDKEQIFRTFEVTNQAKRSDRRNSAQFSMTDKMYPVVHSIQDGIDKEVSTNFTNISQGKNMVNSSKTKGYLHAETNNKVYTNLTEEEKNKENCFQNFTSIFKREESPYIKKGRDSEELQAGDFDSSLNNSIFESDQEKSRVHSAFEMPSKVSGDFSGLGLQGTDTLSLVENVSDESSTNSNAKPLEGRQSIEDYAFTQNELRDRNLDTSLHSKDLIEDHDTDISSARKKIDASSQAFMEQLRGAANRRRNQVIRSRDSLIAKQQEQRESVTVAFVTRGKSEPSILNQKPKLQATPFKALPMPSSLGCGQVGIPKIEKKPPTNPTSPLLGRRRQHKVNLPSNYGSGQVGVPKVDKKPPTTPFSPLLGKKRQQKVKVPALEKCSVLKASTKESETSTLKDGRFDKNQVSDRLKCLTHKANSKNLPLVKKTRVSKRTPNLNCSKLSSLRKRCTGKEKMSESSTEYRSDSSTHSLVGLNILSPDSRFGCSIVENVVPNSSLITPVKQTKSAYTPHSTVRAEKRAQYNRLRDENEVRRLSQLKNNWEKEIILKQSRISELRKYV